VQAAYEFPAQWNNVVNVMAWRTFLIDPGDFRLIGPSRIGEHRPPGSIVSRAYRAVSGPVSRHSLAIGSVPSSMPSRALLAIGSVPSGTGSRLSLAIGSIPRSLGSRIFIAISSAPSSGVRQASLAIGSPISGYFLSVSRAVSGSDRRDFVAIGGIISGVIGRLSRAFRLRGSRVGRIINIAHSKVASYAASGGKWHRLASTRRCCAQVWDASAIQSTMAAP